MSRELLERVESKGRRGLNEVLDMIGEGPDLVEREGREGREGVERFGC
jgi:hypothetical protein